MQIYCEPQEPVIYSTINDEFSHVSKPHTPHH